jgi:hypothetical protein
MNITYKHSTDDAFILEAIIDNEPFAWIREIETGFVVYTAISPKKFKTLEEALEYIER